MSKAVSSTLTKVGASVCYGFGLLSDASISPISVLTFGLLALAGNFIGGIGLVSLSHVAQAKAAERGSGD